MNIGHLRKKLKNKRFLNKLLNELLLRSDELHDFYLIKCNPNRVSELEYNKNKHSKMKWKNDKQMDFIEMLIDEVEQYDEKHNK